MAVSKNQVGFECEFVEAPADYLQSECPICLHILRKPYQVTCCGKSFCRQCIERVKENNKPCPCCNEDDFNDFPNKGLQQPLYGFIVYCVNKEGGCEWKGELGQLDCHLNLNPQNDKELEGCEFAEVECSYCSHVLVRNKLHHHKIELCDERPFSCEYCNQYESTYNDVIHNHLQICGCYPIRCPNKCDAFPQRQELDNHLQRECPLAEIECEFHYVGCEVRLPRRNMPDHLKNGVITHFSLLAMSHKQQQDELKVYQEEWKAHQEESRAVERKQQEEINVLTKEIEELRMQTQQLRHTLPIEFVVNNLRVYSMMQPWSSTPFYSHSHGYKLYLTLDRNPWTNTYTIRCYLKQGEFDGLLKWPLKAVMQITLVCQQGQGEDYKLSIELKCNDRLRDGAEGVKCGHCSIGHTILHQYLHNDCLQIRVVGVQF